MSGSIRRFLFTTLAALTFAGLSATAGAAQANDATQDSVQRSFKVGSSSTLRVENYKGKIDIRGTDGDQIVVHALKHFEGSDTDRKWWMENLTIDMDSAGGRTRVKVTYPQHECMFCSTDYQAWVELEIEVPRKTNLDIDGYKPRMEVTRVEGDIKIQSYKAPIHLVGTTGGIRIDTYKETVKLEDVTVRGRLAVKAYKGEIVVEAKSLGDEASVENEHGTIVVRVPSNTGINLDFAGGRKAIFRSDFPLTTNGNYASRSIQAKINAGGTTLRLRTDKGLVSLEKWRAEI